MLLTFIAIFCVDIFCSVNHRVMKNEVVIVFRESVGKCLNREYYGKTAVVKCP